MERYLSGAIKTKEQALENSAISTPWMSGCQWHANAGAILDESFCDFDAQADRLTGHDQEYVQLSSGHFRGRFISCFLGPQVSLHAEYASQILQQTVLGAQNAFSVGVTLDKNAQFRVHGRDIGWGDLFVVPPKGILHLRSPANASILAVVIDKSLMQEKLAASPQIVDWLKELDDRPAVCSAPIVAERLRHDAYSALKSSSVSVEGELAQAALGDVLATSFTASLMLEWARGVKFSDTAVPKSFERFLAVRASAGLPEARFGIEAISASLDLSRRSIQYACSQEGMMGFSAYHRLLRLHAVRRSLRTNHQKERSIGDIAAEFGFLNWSYFGEQYRAAFGERPSDTRGS